ncbi:MAG: hypothetical protein ABI950_07655 [Solirubrobacteraceae bacterium]
MALWLPLAVLGFVRSIWLAAIVMAVFFAAYFVAYEPYRALYPDLMDDEIAGRAQSSQAIFRGLGTFLALLGGGLLFSISAALPFLAAAIIVGASLTSFTLVGIRRRRRAEVRRDENVGDAAKRVIDIVRGDKTMQAFLVANALWELALAALKTFVVLWATKTLGFSLAGSSGAIAAGAAFGGGATMSLPYALLMPMMPHGQHGSVTGLYSLSRGVGTSLGPLLGGVAVQLAGQDYKWVWLVCAVSILLSIPAMHPLHYE